MSKKKTRHSAKDGKFVSKEFAESNPDEVVEVTNHDHKDELEKFRSWIIENGKDINSEAVVSEYLTKKQIIMEAKELRIGNYIERHNKVTGIKDIVQVDGITPLLWFERMTTLKFNPIPLTEEWKQKLGFTTVRIEPYFIKSYTQIPEHIKFVHQLQNLYFALTGEELTIKN